jgi:hypothetical protein
MYLSIYLFFTYLSIYIYMSTFVSLLFVCMSFSIWKIFLDFVQDTSCRLRTQPQILLVVVDLRIMQYAVKYWEVPYSLKGHDEQWYCHEPKYLSISLSICLSISIYIYICFFFLSFPLPICLSESILFVQATSCRLRRPTQILLVIVALHHNNCAGIH